MMNEEPPTPLFPGFMEWHVGQFRYTSRSHCFMGSLDGADMYAVCTNYDHSGDWAWGCLLVWGNWHSVGFVGCRSMVGFHGHHWVREGRAKHLAPVAELALKLVQLHQ